MTTSAFDINLMGLDILLVEDDPTFLHLISHTISKHGGRLETALTGTDGLGMFKEQNFPIVITDINLPGMSGIELAEQIKAIRPETQIIAISTCYDTNSLVSAIDLKFADFFIKPLKIENLLWAVNKCEDIIACQRRLEDERGKFKAVVESMGEGIAIKDLDYRIQYQNRTMIEMFGDRTGSVCYAAFGIDEPCEGCPTIMALKDGRTHSACRDYTTDDKTIHIESTASLIRDSRGVVTGTVEIIRDISERIENENRIREMAFHDPLTGLANRRLFQDRLEQAIATSQRYGMPFGLLTLDLDNFKDINDCYGHEAGDKVLREAADRIRACCKRDLDTISRMGGDEFCIICADCNDREQLDIISQELLSQFELPFQLDDTLVDVTTSIGISMYPVNGTEAKELEIASDRAMYAAKKAGRNTSRFWEAQTSPRVQQQVIQLQEAVPT
jgi:diguanylate cyclase (GGDEF)-like protein